MQFRNVKILVRAFVFLFLIINISLFAQVPPTPETSFSPEEIEKCKQVVETYCKAWIDKDYDTMYDLLSSKGMGKMEKEKFISNYATYASKSCKLTSFEIQTTSTNIDIIILKAKLSFEKEIKPNMINGVHSFYLEKDNDQWKIKNIIAPITLPIYEDLPGGSHPGE